MLFNIPWWIFLILLFICFSGFMSYRAMKAEKVLEQQFIEREGQIYMERIRQDKLRREQSNLE